MPDYTSIINTIRSAIYGRDMREAIAQGFELCSENGGGGEYLCTGCTIPLDDPTQKEYTFGSTVKKLSRSQSSTDSIADKGYTVTKSIKSYVTNS